MAIYQGRILLTGWPGAPGAMTLYADGLAEPAGTSSQAKASAWAAILQTFKDDIKAQVNSAIVMTTESPMIARDPVSGAGIAEFTVATGPTAGTLTGGILPSMSALVVGWRTSLPTRQGRGRTFLPLTNETNNDTSGTPEPAYITAMSTAATNLIANSTASTDVKFVVWSRPAPLASPPRTGVARPVLAFRIRDTWGSLRSRRD